MIDLPRLIVLGLLAATPCACKARSSQGASILRDVDPDATAAANALMIREYHQFFDNLAKAYANPLQDPGVPPAAYGDAPQQRRDVYLANILAGNQRLSDAQVGQVRALAVRAFYSAFEIVSRNPYGVPPPDQDWTANSVIVNPTVVTDATLGDAQGATPYQGQLYLYGDLAQDTPRVGIIREYSFALQPTGRSVRLTRQGVPLIIHPSGLSFDPQYGVLLSDTWQHKGTIYRLDWAKAWADGNLDNAVLATVVDDVAINGARAVFVEIGGHAYVASADYGDVTPKLRLYDTEALLASGKTSDPGVLAVAIDALPFNQNLYWDDATGRLYMPQNVAGGLGWRLDVINLAAASRANSVGDPGVRVRTQVYLPHDELEGWTMLPNGQELFVTSSYRQNLTLGTTKAVAPRPSLAGEYRIDDASEDAILNPK